MINHLLVSLLLLSIVLAAFIAYKLGKKHAHIRILRQYYLWGMFSIGNKTYKCNFLRDGRMGWE